MSAQNDTPIKKGAMIRVKFPFYIGEHQTFNGESHDVKEVWIPGCVQVFCEPDGVDLFAHGIGSIVLTVVDTFKPGKYPERVFYTRSWIDPDGNVFGKTKLHITTIQTFKRRAMGFYHEYSLAGADE